MRYFRAAIRISLFFGMTFCVYLIWFLGSFAVRNKIHWRRMIFRFWSKSFIRISGMTVKTIGSPPQAPFILVSNHLSYVDVAVFGSLLETVFVAKSDVGKWFIAGKIIRDFGTIFVDRNNRRDIPRAGRKIIDAFRSGDGVVVFPEGTSTCGDRVLPFNPALLDTAAKNKLAVSYASITFKTPDSEPGAAISVCWWDETVFIAHLWRLFSLRGFTSFVHFGTEPIADPDRKELARLLRAGVLEIFVPID